MKLSEAMREGAKKRPQVRGVYTEMRGKRWGSCALSAALEGAAGIKPLRFDADKLDALYPEIADETNSWRNPENGDMQCLNFIICNLNDDYDWTREAIADWLEGLGL